MGLMKQKESAKSRNRPPSKLTLLGHKNECFSTLKNIKHIKNILFF